MKFSVFLNILCENRISSIRRKEQFVKGLFLSTGLGFFYDDDYAKKLANPGSSGKPLSDDIRMIYKVNFPISHMEDYLKNSLNQNRLNDLLDALNVEKDEKKDFNILTEALSLYFEIFMQIGENEKIPDFKNVYSTLIDQHGNGAIIQANEKALLAAKEAFYSALQNLLSISHHDDELLKYKGPFENYFADINKVFRIFEAKCNREGRILFKSIKDQALNLVFEEEEDFDINDYLDLISIPGSMPIDLQKTIKFLLYDNIEFKDKKTELIVNIYDDFKPEMKIDALSNIEFYNLNEIHFSEFISFNIEGSKRNLLEDAFYILYRVDMMLSTLENHFEKTNQICLINKKIEELFKHIRYNEYVFCRDGIFFPQNKKTKYFIPCGIVYTDKKGRMFEMGDEKTTFDRIWFMNEAKKYNVDFKSNNTEFINIVQFYFKLRCKMFEITSFDAFLSEIITINKDGTARHYIFSVDCKAKYYRTIRKIANRVYKDNTVAFISQSIMVNNLASHVTKEMTSEDRIKIGTDVLCCFGFNVDECFAFEATKEQIQDNEYTFIDKPIFRAFGPLMANIIANVKNRDELDKKFKNK